jgi:multidrug efflux system membrane fusion protein
MCRDRPFTASAGWQKEEPKMKLIPLLTAILVTAFLYFLVFERDDLLAFAQTETTGETEDTSDTTETNDEPARVIRVFALK